MILPDRLIRAARPRPSPEGTDVFSVDYELRLYDILRCTVVHLLRMYELCTNKGILTFNPRRYSVRDVSRPPRDLWYTGRK